MQFSCGSPFLIRPNASIQSKILITKCNLICHHGWQVHNEGAWGEGGTRVSFGIWNFCMSLNYCNIIRVFIWHAPRGDRATDRVCTQFCGKWQKNAAEHIDNEEDIEVSLKSLENWAPTADERWENWKLATDNWAALRLNWNWWCARYWFARWFARRQTETETEGPRDKEWRMRVGEGERARLRVLPANLCRSRNVEHAATSHFSAKVCSVWSGLWALWLLSEAAQTASDEAHELKVTPAQGAPGGSTLRGVPGEGERQQQQQQQWQITSTIRVCEGHFNRFAQGGEGI